MSNDDFIKWIIAIGVGLIMALLAFQMATDPLPARQKVLEEAVVLEARQILGSYVLPGETLQLVDPLAPDRKVGKAYIWPVEEGWDVSGFYRRDKNDRWHPYLMSLDSDAQLRSLAVSDSNQRLIGMSAQDSKFSAVP